ncbi:zinc finger protein 431-like [Diorhabda carinulata]|uniref:zinc finger protein 431-like n=1 Tax=Diorhabda carinulata TaxID=1163345 RepID=UPI0025A135E0|nr:zinc finger protein 431-like [Diorhabda carinulata]
MAEKIEIRVNIPTEELVQKCRTCLKNDGVLNLFLTRHKDVMLYQLFPMLSLPEMDPTDSGLPQKICGICAKAVFEFYAFKERTLQTQVIIELAAGKLRYLNIEETQDSKTNETVDSIIYADSGIKQENQDYVDDEQNIKQETVSDINIVKQELENFEDHGIIKKIQNGDTTKQKSRVVAQCRFCKKKFNKYSDYLNHRTEEKEKRIKVDCPICHDNIMSYRMENHLLVHKMKGQVDSKETEELINISNEQTNKDVTTDHYYLETLSNDSDAITDLDYMENSEFVDNMEIEESPQYACLLCDLKFENRREYINHRREEKEKRQKKPCPICNEQIPLFQMEKHYFLHDQNTCKDAKLMIDPQSDDLTCSCCNGIFNDKNEFMLHVKNDSNRKPKMYPCSICNEKFTLTKLRDHMTIHSTNMKQYMCEVCGKQFAYKTSLRFHKHSKVTEESLCDLCGKSFISQFSLKLHKQRVHVEMEGFSCEFCDKLFEKNQHRIIHERQHTGEKPYECNICGKNFTKRSLLETHLKGHDSNIKFQCSTCHQIFLTSELLTQHEKVHKASRKKRTKKVEKSKCDMCNHLVIDLDGHKQAHNAGFTYVCGYCNEGFTKRYDLTTHKISVHFTKRRIFKCDICDKSVTTSQMLESHRRIHTGEKPFQCEICKKSFTQGSHLHTHMKWHTGEKKFECEFCRKKFSLKGNLKQHLRSHTGDKPFTCDICTKGFPTGSSLRKHLAIHNKFKAENLNLQFLTEN